MARAARVCTIAEATNNRKDETSDFKTLYASDSAAKEILLAFTKDRLNKFYKPTLYKPEEADGPGARIHHRRRSMRKMWHACIRRVPAVSVGSSVYI